MMQVETIHNYISFDDHIIRKGAIASYVNQKMVIPFNMRDGLLICEGKSNNEWNNSAPHGAGRVFSRSQAKDVFTLEEYQKTMNGIFSTSVVESTLDESPMAYKDAAVIEKAIEPTANIILRVKPIYNVKAK
jgi:RNA-splicing ligase RtcB